MITASEETPARGIQLAAVVAADTDDRAVTSKPNRVNPARCDGDNVLPRRHITLPEVRSSCGDHRPPSGEANRVIAACGDGDDPCPCLTASPERGLTGRPDRTVTHECDSMEVPGRQGDHLTPGSDVALSARIASRRPNSAVRHEGDSVPVPARNALNLLPARQRVRVTTSRRDNGSVTVQPHAESPPRSDRGDVLPVQHVALPVRVPAAGFDSSVRPQTEGM